MTITRCIAETGTPHMNRFGIGMVSPGMIDTRCLIERLLRCLEASNLCKTSSPNMRGTSRHGYWITLLRAIVLDIYKRALFLPLKTCSVSFDLNILSTILNPSAYISIYLPIHSLNLHHVELRKTPCMMNEDEVNDTDER